MGRLYIVGSLNVDSVIEVHRHPGPGETVLGTDPRTFWGGKGANQAIAAARAGEPNSRIVFIGRVGDDEAGHEYRARLDSFGIDVTYVVSTASTPTGSAIIAVSGSGENSIIVSLGANAWLAPADLSALAEACAEDVVVLSLEVPLPTVEQAAAYAARAGARLILNFSPTREVPDGIVQQADPLIVNELEADEVTRRYGAAASMLVTRGSNGSDWHGVHVAARDDVTVVDTTGAGDAYCGALAIALANGADTESSMRSGTNAAAAAVARVGAQ